MISVRLLARTEGPARLALRRAASGHFSFVRPYSSLAHTIGPTLERVPWLASARLSFARLRSILRAKPVWAGLASALRPTGINSRPVQYSPKYRAELFQTALPALRVRVSRVELRVFIHVSIAKAWMEQDVAKPRRALVNV